MKVRINEKEYEAQRWPESSGTIKALGVGKGDFECPMCGGMMSEHGTIKGLIVCPGQFVVETEEGMVAVDPGFVESVEG